MAEQSTAEAEGSEPPAGAPWFVVVTPAVAVAGFVLGVVLLFVTGPPLATLGAALLVLGGAGLAGAALYAAVTALL
jgi:hypothetical protein